MNVPWWDWAGLLLLGAILIELWNIRRGIEALRFTMLKIWKPDVLEPPE